MIEFTGLNIFAILVGWVITALVGTFWYSPAGFGKQWSKLSGSDLMKLPKNEAGRAIIVVAVSGLLQVLALSVVLNSIGTKNVGEGIVAALILWFGFTALTTLGPTLYQRLSVKFWLLNAGYFFVVMVVNGIILTIWK